MLTIDINEIVQKIIDAPLYSLIVGTGGLLAIVTPFIVAKIQKKNSSDEKDKEKEQFVVKIDNSPQMYNNYCHYNYNDNDNDNNHHIISDTTEEKIIPENSKTWKINKNDISKDSAKEDLNFHNKEYFINFAASVTIKQKPGDEFNYVQKNG